MGEQKHVVKRQIIELGTQNMAEAQRLQVEMSRVYRHWVIPLIDQYCTTLSEPDRLYRIESLQVDLGYVDAQKFEAAFLDKLSQVLYHALAEQIGAQRPRTGDQEADFKAISQIELFTFFVSNGSLPWWADATQPKLLEKNLQFLIEAAPEQLYKRLREFLPDQRCLQRIIHHYHDELLGKLAGILLPALEASLTQDLGDLITILQRTKAATSRRPSQIRCSTWSNILQVAGLGQGQDSQSKPFYQRVLVRIAAELETVYASLLTNIYELMLANNQGIRSELQETIESLYRDDGGETFAIAQYPAQWADLKVALYTLIPRLPKSAQTVLLTLLNTLESSGYQPARARFKAIQRVLAPLQLDLSEANILLTSLSLNDMSEPEDMLQHPARTEERSSHAQAKYLPPAFSFSAADEIYISNAGLVILWPFLNHIFGRLGLLEDKQFKDGASQQRATGLLQYLVNEEQSPQEYLLPLNKLLCGMELDEVFDFGVPITDREVQECTNLLTATIAQAPILRNMSIPGFQATFLLRPGVLSRRDGAWLLRVERETYDLVLDRFSWGWSWIKLPWMEAPLQVEW